MCGGWEPRPGSVPCGAVSEVEVRAVPTGHCGHHVVSSEDLAGERSCAVLVVSWCVAELGVV